MVSGLHGHPEPWASEGDKLRTVCGEDGSDVLAGADLLAGPRGNEGKHFYSTLITFPLDGTFESPLVLAAAISSASLCVRLPLDSPLAAMS